LARPAHGKISRNFGEIPQDDNKIGADFAKFEKIAPDFLIFQSISRNFRSVLPRLIGRSRHPCQGNLNPQLSELGSSGPIRSAVRTCRAKLSSTEHIGG
jgi:hypothetical protein